jgi:hypothetical protein
MCLQQVRMYLKTVHNGQIRKSGNYSNYSHRACKIHSKQGIRKLPSSSPYSYGKADFKPNYLTSNLFLFTRNFHNTANRITTPTGMS